MLRAHRIATRPYSPCIAWKSLQMPTDRRRFFACTARSLTDKKQKPILTEYVYGRTRIYTSLSSMAKGKPATSGKTRVGSSITSSPSLSWQWLMPHDKRAHANAAAAAHSIDYSDDRTAPRFNIVSSLRQNFTEMFLPVGYVSMLPLRTLF